MTQALVVTKDTLEKTLSEDANLKAEALSTLRHDPVRALQLLQSPVDSGLSTHGAALVLDEVAAVLPADEAADILAHNMSPARLAELMAERGDLGSTVVLLANRQIVIQALMSDLEDGKSVDVAVRLKYWAQKLKDREDWEEFLEEIIGEETVRWYLLMLIWNEAGRPGFEGAPDQEDNEFFESEYAVEEDELPETIYDIDPQKFLDFGLDVEDSKELLINMILDDSAIKWGHDLLMDAVEEWQVQRYIAQMEENKDSIRPVAAIPNSSAAELAAEFENE